MKRSYLLLSLSCILFNLGLIYSQPTNSYVGDIAPASPNAGSLGKYVDIPVSYHTGVPKTSIDIFNVQNGGLSLPITLNYHASGIRVGEMASWVGLGWTLQSGGMITRTI